MIEKNESSAADNYVGVHFHVFWYAPPKVVIICFCFCIAFYLFVDGSAATTTMKLRKNRCCAARRWRCLVSDSYSFAAAGVSICAPSALSVLGSRQESSALAHTHTHTQICLLRKSLFDLWHSQSNTHSYTQLRPFINASDACVRAAPLMCCKLNSGTHC